MSLKAKAYAKINLFLGVIGKRPDGYHNLDTVMQSVSIYDEISLDLTDNGVCIKCNKEELAGEDNIVYKACKAFFKLSGEETGVNISISKNIPVAAGLGGGSADAAATLLMLNKATGKNYSLEQLLPVAAQLGADVPFFLVGGTMRAKGIGDILEPLNAKKMYYVVLKELEKQSTGHMYNMIDNSAPAVSGNIDQLIRGLDMGNADIISDNLFNAFSACWNMNEMTACFKPFNPNGVFLSGSGPTVCAYFSDKSKAEICAEELAKRYNNVFYAENTPKAIEIE